MKKLMFILIVAALFIGCSKQAKKACNPIEVQIPPHIMLDTNKINSIDSIDLKYMAAENINLKLQ